MNSFDPNQGLTKSKKTDFTGCMGFTPALTNPSKADITKTSPISRIPETTETFNFPNTPPVGSLSAETFNFPNTPPVGTLSATGLPIGLEAVDFKKITNKKPFNRKTVTTASKTHIPDALSFGSSSWHKPIRKVTPEMIRGNQAIELLNSIIYLPKIYVLVDKKVLNNIRTIEEIMSTEGCDQTEAKYIRMRDRSKAFTESLKTACYVTADDYGLLEYKMALEDKDTEILNSGENGERSLFRALIPPEYMVYVNTGTVRNISTYADLNRLDKLTAIISNVTGTAVTDTDEALKQFAKWLGLRDYSFDTYCNLIEASADFNDASRDCLEFEDRLYGMQFEALINYVRMHSIIMKELWKISHDGKEADFYNPGALTINVDVQTNLLRRRDNASIKKGLIPPYQDEIKRYFYTKAYKGIQ